MLRDFTTSHRSVSVIICTYSEERWELLRTALDSVRYQRYPASEIIVVVDHNISLFERARSELLATAITENKYERGLSGSRNTGIDMSRGAVVAFLDDDEVAQPDWIERMVGDYGDQVLGVGGTTVPIWMGNRPRWFPDEFAWVVGCSYQGLPLGKSPVRNLFGGNMSFRREVFESVGGFRQGLGRVDNKTFGCEETELCIRARLRWKQGVFLYEPTAKVYHHVPASYGTWRHFRNRCYAEGLSKAVVSRLVGFDSALASERSYTFHTLPRGVARGMVAGLIGLRPTGLAQAAAIVFGFAITALGYAEGRLQFGGNLSRIDELDQIEKVAQ